MNSFDALADLWPADPAPAFAVGTIKSFTTNGTDPPSVVVTWRGADVSARCPRHYTPAAGHVVLMARVGPQLLIIGAY